MKRFRRRNDSGHQPRSRLEALGLDEIDIGPHGRELENLIKALVQTDGLDIVKTNATRVPACMFSSLNWNAVRLTLNRLARRMR
jgi:hypothetical protein